MKRLFILLFILFHLTCLSDAKKDSLQVLVNSGVDSTRIIGLIEMSKLLMFKNPDTGLSIGIEALALSIKINDQKRIGLSHLRLFGCHWLLSQIDSCVNDGLSAAAAFEKANNPLLLGQAYSALGIVYRSIGKYPQALKYNLDALAIKYSREIH